MKRHIQRCIKKKDRMVRRSNPTNRKSFNLQYTQREVGKIDLLLVYGKKDDRQAFVPLKKEGHFEIASPQLSLRKSLKKKTVVSNVFCYRHLLHISGNRR